MLKKVDSEPTAIGLCLSTVARACDLVSLLLYSYPVSRMVSDLFVELVVISSLNIPLNAL